MPQECQVSCSPRGIFARVKDSRCGFGSCSGVSVNFNNPSASGLGVSWQFTHERTFRRGKKLVPSWNNLGGFAPKAFGMESKGRSWQVRAPGWAIPGFTTGWEHGWDIQAFLQCKSNFPGDLSHNWEWGQQVQGCGAFKPLTMEPQKSNRATEGRGISPRWSWISVCLPEGEWERVMEPFGGKSHLSQTRKSLIFLPPEQVPGKLSLINLWVSITSQ